MTTHNGQTFKCELPDPLQVRLGGTGGQGVITAGIILAQAAMLEGRNAVQTQSYGAEARLGASKCEVILSSGKITYPEVEHPDVLVCLSQQAYKHYCSEVDGDTIIILDDGIRYETSADRSIIALPIVGTATQIGGMVLVSVVAVTVMNALLGIVSPQSLRQAVLARVKPKYRAMNEKAIDAAEQLAQSAQPALAR